jgi:hypothetical protein
VQILRQPQRKTTNTAPTLLVQYKHQAKSQSTGGDGNILYLAHKAVNRGDKRSRRYRDRHFAKFERSRRYQDCYRCQEKKSRRGRGRYLVFRDPPPRRERELDR